jgi:CP family cyanate transporter-like MFS transporter
VGGLLLTIPVLCTGIVALPSPLVARRVGARFGISVALAGIAVFGVARAFVPGAALVILFTVPIGLGVGVAQALMPVLVKENAAMTPAFATGVYVSGFAVGAAVATAVAVPAADALNGWRGSFAAFGLFAAVLFCVWLALTRSVPRNERPLLPRPHLPLRSGIAWWLLLILALNASLFYGLTSWLPASYTERGWSQDRAALLLTVMILASLPVGFAIPWLVDRVGSRRVYLVGSAALLTCGMVGLIVKPGGAWFWVSLIGAANVVVFVISLTLPLDVSNRPDEVAALTGLMLCGGYACAALAPVGLGAARDVTGNFDLTLWLLAADAALLTLASLPLSPERLRHALAHAQHKAISRPGLESDARAEAP